MAGEKRALVVGMLPKRGVFGGEDQLAVDVCAALAADGWDARGCGESDAFQTSEWFDPHLVLGLSCPIAAPRRSGVAAMWHFNERVSPEKAFSEGWDEVFSDAKLLVSSNRHLPLASLTSCLADAAPSSSPRLAAHVGNLTSFKDRDDVERFLVSLAEAEGLVLWGSGWEKSPALARAWRGPLDPESWKGLAREAAVMVSFATPLQREMGCVNDRVYCAAAAGMRVVAFDPFGSCEGLEWVTRVSDPSSWRDAVEAAVGEASEEGPGPREARTKAVAEEHLYSNRTRDLLREIGSGPWAE